MTIESTELFNNESEFRFPNQTLPTREFERICTRTIDNLKNNSMFEGLILVGSFSKQTQDQYSDIDFIIVTTDKMLADAFEYWSSILDDIKSVFIKDEMETLECLSSLETTPFGIIKIDYDFVENSQLKENFEESISTGTGLIDGEVLFDKSGRIQRLFDARFLKSGSLKWPKVYTNQFLISMWSALRMIYRKELYEAFDIINTLRDPFILSLLSELHNKPFENYRHLEKVIDEKWLKRFQKTFCNPNEKELIIACSQILNLYHDLCTICGIEFTATQRSTVEIIEKNLYSDTKFKFAQDCK